MLFSYLAHRRTCNAKQKERQDRISNLTEPFQGPLSPYDVNLLAKPTSELISAVQRGYTAPRDILIAYSKKAIEAHEATNCLTEVMIDQAELWAEKVDTKGPLVGVPISLKDTVCVEGFDSCIGYAGWVGKPAEKDSAIIRLLKDAGAVPFVKTNVPITLLSFESASDVWGTTENPHKKGYSPGGSTGGEAALLAFGGSRIGIGTDVAGSVRVPSHYSGVYTIKASTQRFMKAGNATSVPGQEGVAAVYSPMARTLEDLETAWRGIMSMKPWTYDYSCLPIPWRNVDLSEKKKLKWGVMWNDGVVTPSPACTRALVEVVSVLRDNGHQIVSVNPPSPYEGFEIGAQLLADACKVSTFPILPAEHSDPGMVPALRMYHLPLFLKRIYAFYLRHIRRDPMYAHLVETWHKKSAIEYFALVARKEAYKARWFDWWEEQGDLDFILTVPNACPAVPHRGMKDAWTSCGYSFLFNILDYSAGVLPITHVDREQDALSPIFRPSNAIERGAYKLYDADKMHGLPVGVQVIGRRLEEEKVLEGMKVVEKLLRLDGKAYELLNC
ncbi:hypothetical protein JAAARDRAFT_32815 [Jaapia argillacea MUCL 33604]|uniref:amidase n=1 Tax=Jaapia argillacea MUCL 33604 TaxID=933084 RepID=A0A067Q010_9AGAM|nr:hypothetical protein JAAARDRAFT_32815 [Jaapia argillacea MUCL 33604]